MLYLGISSSGYIIAKFDFNWLESSLVVNNTDAEQMLTDGKVTGLLKML